MGHLKKYNIVNVRRELLMKYRIGCQLLMVLGLGFGLLHVVCAEEAKAAKVSSAEDTEQNYFAIVGEQRVPLEEFQAAFRKGVKQKFYHGKVSRSEVETFKKEVAESLVIQTLLGQEARRRKIEIDQSAIDKKIKAVDQRNSKIEEWAKSRKEVLAILKERLTVEELVKKLELNVRNIAQPTEKELNEYYENHKDVFTAPQQWGVSIILLKVDPSSPSDAWAAASDEAAHLVERIRGGADFAELARIHSGDDSAENGGDMGYLHIGMLAKPAQQVLNLMEPGEVSEPVMLLQGVAIFRLDGIHPARLNPFSKVKERARELWLRENSEKAWDDLIKKLRADTKVEYGKSVFEVADVPEDTKG